MVRRSLRLQEIKELSNDEAQKNTLKRCLSTDENGNVPNKIAKTTDKDNSRISISNDISKMKENLEDIAKTINEDNCNTKLRYMEEKITDLEKKMEKFESEAKCTALTLVSQSTNFEGLRSKVDTICNALNDSWEKQKEEMGLKSFYPYYGNIMTPISRFDMDSLMTSHTAGTYGKSGHKIARKIMSYLDYESLLKARIVSKTWYKFFEEQRSKIWTKELRIKYRDAREKHETELYNWTSDKPELKQWKKLVQEVEKNGSVADIISLIPRLNKDNFYDAPVYVPESNDLSIILRDLRFLKLVQKFNFFKGMKHCDFFKNLITWAVNDMDALNFVMPIAKNSETYLECKCQGSIKHPFPIKKYGKYGKCPIEKIIRNDLGLDKLKMIVPITSKTFWNTGGVRSPLVDAIMIGNMDIINEILPLTNINANPKRRFGSYLHVAARYGQMEIFKLIFDRVKDWKSLKDSRDRTILEQLKDDDFDVDVYDKKTGKTRKANASTSIIFKMDLLKYIKEKNSDM